MAEVFGGDGAGCEQLLVIGGVEGFGECTGVIEDLLWVY